MAARRPRGPSGVNDLRLEVRGVMPVPPSQRFGSPARLFTLWFTAQISPSTFFVGALGTAGYIALGWRWGLFTIVVGNLLGSITVAILATIGSRTGAPQVQASRLTFGRTVHFPAALTWVTQIGFEALAAIFGAQALHVLFGLDDFVGLVITFVCMGALSIFGYEVIHLFEKVMAVVLLVLFGLITAKTFLGHPHLTNHVSGAGLAGSIILMLAIVFSYAVSWGPISSDYSRYLPEQTRGRWTFLAAFSGLVLGMTWVEILGFAGSALARHVSSMAGVAQIMNGGGLGDVSMVAMFLGTIAILAVEDYSGALAANSFGVPLARPLVTLVSAAVAFGAAAWLNSGATGPKFEDVLLLISYWITPWTAIVLIDWYRRGRHLGWAQFQEVLAGPFRRLASGWDQWAAAIALFSGFVVCLPFSNTATGSRIAADVPSLSWYFGGFSTHFLNGGDVAFYVGFLVGAMVYWTLVTLRGHVGSAAAGPTAAGSVPLAKVRQWTGRWRWDQLESQVGDPLAEQVEEQEATP